MRVLAVQPFLKSASVTPEASASARTSARLTEELVRQGCDVQLFPAPEPVGTAFLWAIAPGHSVRVWPSLELPVAGDMRLLVTAAPRLRPRPRPLRQLYFAWMELIALRRALALGKPEVVHDHIGLPRIARMTRSLGSPVPILLSHPEGPVESDLSRYAAVVFPSRMARGRHGGTARRADVIPPPVSTTFLSDTLRESVEPNSLLFIIGPRSSGALGILLEALSRDDRLRTDCRLTVCGEVSQPEAVRARVERERLPVVLTGTVSAAHLRDSMDRAAIVLLTGQPGCGSRALREAACRGLPALTWSDQAEDFNESLGLQAAAGVGAQPQGMDPIRFAEQIRGALAGEAAMPSRRGERARLARETFSPKRHAERHIRLYEEATRGMAQV